MSEQQPLSRADIMAWRKDERTRLLGARRAMPGAVRRAASEAIADTLSEILAGRRGEIVSLYWPINHEPNLIPLMERLPDIRFALPVVVERGKPLLFRAWRKGEELARGIWNIPVPVAAREVEPDILVAPVVGYDSSCFRLGYGGGFFDRTLAKLPGRRVFGVGYASARIPTIHPLLHDIPMSAIVTEKGMVEPSS